MAFVPAIPTMSLGSPGLHGLQHNLDQAAKSGFKGVEIFYGDLDSLSKTIAADGSAADDDDDDDDESRLLVAARKIRSWCDDLSLVVIGPQPFMHYEGLIDRKEHEQRIEKLRLWFRLVKILGTDVIQIPTNILQEGITGDTDVLVQDMVEVANMGMQEDPVVRFAYENLCWGTHIDTWHGVWDIVVRVDKPNFGICLDTFNIAGREWADPTSPDGKIPNADETLEASLERLRRTVDVKKVFYVQVVDGQRLSRPLVKGHELYSGNMPARADWSRGERLFNSEAGGYLPIIEVLKAITEEGDRGLGYKGWISLELFSATTSEEAEDVPEWHAQRAQKAWEVLVKDMKW